MNWAALSAWWKDLSSYYLFTLREILETREPEVTRRRVLCVFRMDIERSTVDEKLSECCKKTGRKLSYAERRGCHAGRVRPVAGAHRCRLHRRDHCPRNPDQ